MKILLAGSIQGDGSYEEADLCVLLKHELRDAGHMVDCFFLPYERNILSLPEQLLAYRMLDINSCDLLITVGYPACILRHPNKVCYLLQTEPMLAEYWDSQYGVLANWQYSNILYSVKKANKDALREAKKVLCCSTLLAEDVQRTYGIESKVQVYPVLELICEDESEPADVICESALLPWQRPELLLKWFSLEKEKRAALFVPNTHQIYWEQINRLIQKNELEDRVKLFCRRAAEADLKNASVVFVPDYQSRRIPNIMLEASRYGKPVLCMKDGGAIAELLPKNNHLTEMELADAFAKARYAVPADEMTAAENAFLKELLA